VGRPVAEYLIKDEMKQFRWIGAFVVGALLLAACGGLQAAGPEGQLALSSVVTPVIVPDWVSGNAAFECSAVGEYTYAWKIGEGGAEGAPNGSETARFYDLEGNLVHSNTITILNSDGSVFDWSSDPNGIGAVIVKAGQGANVWRYEPDQVKSDTGLYAYQDREVSHVTFCWNDDDVVINEGQWCSPGYWRQPHHLDSWAATGYSPSDLFSAKLGYYPTVSKQGAKEGAATDPTLWQVLQSPQWYGGDAFNAVGDLLSTAHPDVDFLGIRVGDSCPLN
jgi:hypothetical protein